MFLPVYFLLWETLIPYHTCPKIYNSILLLFNPGPTEPGYALPLQTVNPDQLASEEANWSGSALFVIVYEFISKTLIK